MSRSLLGSFSLALFLVGAVATRGLAAPVVLAAEPLRRIPAGAVLESTYLTVDHPGDRVLVKARFVVGEETVTVPYRLPRCVFYEPRGYGLWFEDVDLRLRPLADTVSHSMAPPGFAFRLRPSVEVLVDGGRISVRFDPDAVDDRSLPR